MRKNFILVEAIDGVPVTDPQAPSQSPPRFVGWQHAPENADDADHLLDMYKLAGPQVHLDHDHLRAAIRDKELKLLGECRAASFDAAREQLLKSAPAAKPAAVMKASAPAAAPKGDA